MIAFKNVRVQIHTQNRKNIFFIVLTHQRAMKKILPKNPLILSGVLPFLRRKIFVLFCECENSTFSFVAGLELPEKQITTVKRMDQQKSMRFFVPIFTETRR